MFITTPLTTLLVATLKHVANNTVSLSNARASEITFYLFQGYVINDINELLIGDSAMFFSVNWNVLAHFGGKQLIIHCQISISR